LFARPYVAGDKIDDALEVSWTLLQGAGILTSLDLLAEEVRTDARVQANRRCYLDLIERIAQDPRFPSADRRPTVSVKLSSFTRTPLERGGDGADCRAAMEEIAARARERQVALTIDMEDHHWTDFTLELAKDLFGRGFDVGTVLQSRLHRTERDLAGIPPGMRVRMVIGIYLEPPALALTDKRGMKERLLEGALELLEKGVYVEFATHDEVVLERFLREATEVRRVRPDQFEIQMLYGVPRARILSDILAGRLGASGGLHPKVRLYVPFATDWDQATAYCRRRLKANPHLMLYVARNLLGALRGHRPGLSQYLAENGAA
ncbi:MAG TPA: proline dehydrogenase family protein, partial [Candidatus Polarisedimenticolia bacterium]|nr:proline dehydrogenase family protein [Candidatus Polarisedimenticolia bacterium]